MKKIIFLLLALSLFAGGCALTAPKTPTDTGQKNPPTGNKLILSGKQLAKIPDYVFGEKNLEELDVSNNQITGAIQGEIRQLQNLKILNASYNLMTGVPAEIGQLQNLEVLNLSDNRLTGLPYELGNLKKLKTLNVSGNNYSQHDLDIIVKMLPASVEIVK